MLAYVQVPADGDEKPEMPSATLTYHMQQLENAGLVTSFRQHDRAVRYTVDPVIGDAVDKAVGGWRGGVEALADAAPALGSALRLRVVETLSTRPISTWQASEISSAIGQNARATLLDLAAKGALREEIETVNGKVTRHSYRLDDDLVEFPLGRLLTSLQPVLDAGADAQEARSEHPQRVLAALQKRNLRWLAWRLLAAASEHRFVATGALAEELGTRWTTMSTIARRAVKGALALPHGHTRDRRIEAPRALAPLLVVALQLELERPLSLSADEDALTVALGLRDELVRRETPPAQHTLTGPVIRPTPVRVGPSLER